jgi:hypothetical protein
MSRTRRRKGYHHRNLIDKLNNSHRRLMAAIWKLFEFERKQK